MEDSIKRDSFSFDLKLSIKSMNIFYNIHKYFIKLKQFLNMTDIDIQ
jgi:hypothetical protein